MSDNKVLNAVIALIENRPEVAKELLRSPEMSISVSEVTVRLNYALDDSRDKAIVEVLRKILRKTLVLTSDNPSYMQAVVDVEKIIEGCLYEHAHTDNQMARPDTE